MLPREKLVYMGIESLSSAELIALILGKGSKKENVFAMSERLIQNFGNEILQKTQNPIQFADIFQVTPLQAGRIISSLELGKRLYSKDQKEIFLNNPQKIAEYTKEMKKFVKEYVRGLYVNIQNKLIHDEIISIGSLSANIVHPREVFSPALQHHAYGLILVHNHPSGEQFPSDADINLTSNFFQIAKMMQIEFIDHIIIAQKGWFSFRENGFLKDN